MPPSDDAAPRVPDYELLRLIGRGGYGDVWLARSVTGAFRAIKFVRRDRFADPRPYEREFEGIVRFTAVSLREPSQLALLHVGRDDAANYFYYVMELADDAVRGRDIVPESYVPLTLREVHERRGRLPAGEVVALGAALARALVSLHTAGLVHRDIKPSNIVFVGGVPKLADIGLVAAASAGLTFVGTEGFVPPEGPGAPAADVFSLGKVLYELAAGLDRNDYPRLPADLGAWPDRKEFLELNEVLIRACEPDARHRFPDAAALLDELLLLQAGKSVRRLRSAERRTARALRVAAVLALIAGVAGAGAWVEHTRAAKAEAERDELARRTVYVATLDNAQRALEREDYGTARDLLATIGSNPAFQALRGFEWRVLRRTAEGDPSTVIKEFGAPISRLALSPDGRTLAVVIAAKDLVTLYDVQTRGELRELRRVGGFGGFSADGRWIAGSEVVDQGGRRTARLQRWRVDDGAAEDSTGGGAPLRALAALGDRQLVAFRNATESPRLPPALVIWDFAEQREIAVIPVGEASGKNSWQYFRSSLSPDGRALLLACVRDDQFQLTRMTLDAPFRCEQEPAPIRPGVVGSISTGGAGWEWWIANDSRPELAFFDAATGRWHREEKLSHAVKFVTALETGGGPPMCLSAQDATLVVSEGLSPRHETRRIHGHAAPLTGMVVTQDGSAIFSADERGELRVWDCAAVLPDRTKRQCRDIRSSGTPFAFSPDGRRLFVPWNGASKAAPGETVDAVAVLDAATLAVVGQIEGVRNIFATHGEMAWGVSADRREIIGWSAAEDRITQRLAHGESAIRQAVATHDCSQFCFTRSNGQLGRASADGKAPLLIDGEHQYLWALLLSDDGRLLWSIDRNRRLTCRDLTTEKASEIWGKPLGIPNVSSASRISGHNEIVVAGEDGLVRLFRDDDGQLLRTFAPGSRAIEIAAMLPDGSRLLVVDKSGGVYSFDPRTFTRLGLLATHACEGEVDDKPYNHALSPDSTKFAYLTVAGMLHVLRAQ